MNFLVSPNTRAILLLTAPLMLGGKGDRTAELLSPKEYRVLARRLHELECKPSDLLEKDAFDLLKNCHSAVDSQRLERLLDREFLLAQAVERWQSRGIWVLSRSDEHYPRRFVVRLRDQAPPVLYGCGKPELMNRKGLAVVGSRHVDDILLKYTGKVGKLCALAETGIVSGGAKGVDQAAMHGALEAGGTAVGIMGNALERATLQRQNRDWIMAGQLVLTSPFDPGAGFNVGNAMHRNKFIYALADAALVVNADYRKGGTWNGAVEQLNKYHFVPVYVRSEVSVKGLVELQKLGALPWPEPKNESVLENIFSAEHIKSSHEKRQGMLPIAGTGVSAATLDKPEENIPVVAESVSKAALSFVEYSDEDDNSSLKMSGTFVHDVEDIAGKVLSCIREAVEKALISPMSLRELAENLGVKESQMRCWLDVFVEEGVVDKQKRPVRYSLNRKC